MKDHMKETKGKIAYRFETPVYPANILYVNLVANYSCVNDCLFCTRPRTKSEIGMLNIYEKKAGSFLFLPRPPSIDEIMDSIDTEIRKDDAELAIIGLGEPLIYLPKVVEVIRQVKRKYNIKTRVDTNGLVKCMYSEPAKKLAQAGLDEIRISLNAVNEQEYNQLCKPKFKDAFSNLTSFIRECVNSSIDTYVSFVVGFCAEDFAEYFSVGLDNICLDNKIIRKIIQRTNEEYKAFALSLGINPQNIIFRKYVKQL